MDRVTKRIKPDVVLYAGKHKQYETSDIPAEVNSAGVREILHHLADYEDTGLEPEICAEYKKFEDEIVSKGVTFKRIVALMDAEKDGRLVVLPCRLHEQIYGVEDGEVFDDIPYEVELGQRPGERNDVLLYDCVGGTFFYGDDIGKTVFLTREEAEAALKGRGGDES